MMKEISMHILDIAQNSIAAGSSIIRIEVDIDPSKDYLSVTITDNGRGMDKEMSEIVISPFTTSRTARKVGLGIPFFQAGAMSCDGSFEIRSQCEVGTVIKAKYRLTHIDTPPLGDLASTMLALTVPNDDINFVFQYKRGNNIFDFDTRKVRAVLGEVSLNSPEVIQWIQSCLYEGIAEINGGEY